MPRLVWTSLTSERACGDGERPTGTIRGTIASSANYASSELSIAATVIAGRSATVQSGTGHPTLAIVHGMEILLIKGAKYVESSLHPPVSRSSLDVEEVVQHERVSAPETSVLWCERSDAACSCGKVDALRMRLRPVARDTVRAVAWLTEGTAGPPGVERCAVPSADAGERRASIRGGERLER